MEVREFLSVATGMETFMKNREIILKKTQDHLLIGIFILMELISAIISSIILVDILSNILQELITYRELHSQKLIGFLLGSVIMAFIGLAKKNVIEKAKINMICRTEDLVIKHICTFKTWQIGYDALDTLPVLSSDIAKAVSSYLGILTAGVSLFLGLLLGSVSAIRINLTIYLICLLVVGVIFVITYFSFPVLKKYQTRIGQEFNKNYSNVSEMIQNGDITHLLNQKNVLSEFDAVAKNNLHLNIKKGRVFAWVYLCKKISTIVLVLVVCISAYLVFSIEESLQNNIHNILVLAYLVPKISNNFLAIIDWRAQCVEYKATIKRINTILDHPIYLSDNKEKISSIRSMDICNLSFSYNNHPILSNISLSLKPGNFYFVKGESGCGKSTFMKIIAMLLPVESEKVFVNGIDFNKLDRTNYWTKISYLPQQPIIIPGTIKDNIILNKQEQRDLLESAIKISTLDKTIGKFLGRLDWEIDESKLSSGEKQKICLARALYQQSEILLLDEAISAMDYESQKNVVSQLKNYIHDNSIICLFITHNSVDGSSDEPTLIMQQGKLYVYENN